MLIVLATLLALPVSRPAEALNCPPVEVVFIMDTSGSMVDEATALCTNISQVQADLTALGITSTTHMLAIASLPGGAFGCLTDYVLNLLGPVVPGDDGACGGTLDRFESWGQATAITADRFPWTPGAVRVIVPLSDEGACDGDPCLDPGEDRDTINNAGTQALVNEVFVSPITGTGSNSCVTTLASDVAATTSGLAFASTDPALDIAQAILDVVISACLQSPVFTLAPPVAFNPVGGTDAVTASLGGPMQDVPIDFSVTSGPNAGDTGTEMSDANGDATFAYTGDGGVGVDRIEASFFDDNARAVKPSNEVLKFWDEDCQSNGIPDTCDIDCDGFDGSCRHPQLPGCGASRDIDGNRVPDECRRATTCGDDVAMGPGETCDGTDDAACPGLCHPPGHPSECRCPSSHYQCYEVDQRPRFTRLRGLPLADQFGSSTVDLRRRKRFCNPADKNDEDPGALSNPVHLTGYALRSTTPFDRVKNVHVVNQFGEVAVEVVRPNLLLVPSAKDLNSPPPPLGVSAGEHFQCYRVKRARTRAAGIKVVDQFGTLSVDVKRPSQLCVPVDENGQGILDANVHLMCYQVKTVPQRQFSGIPFFINNPLEATSTAVTRPTELCLPSRLVVSP